MRREERDKYRGHLFVAEDEEGKKEDNVTEWMRL